MRRFGLASVMDAGLYAELAVECAGVCPVARHAGDGRVVSVSRAQADGTVVEEFVRERTAEERVTSGADTAGSTASAGGESATDPERVAAYDGGAVYRFERPADLGCPCEIVESHGVPVRATTREGHLVLTLHPPDRETLGAVARALQSEYHVELRRVIDGDPGAEGRRDVAVVDRDRLTDRQVAALRTAHELGYFERPRGATGEEVARRLGVAPSTFTEHLRRAQRKVLDAVCATGEAARPAVPGDD